MDWIEIRDILQNKHFEIDNGAFSYIGDMHHNEGPIALTFTYLGAGTNKVAVRINGENWVILLGKPLTNSFANIKNFDEEINTLQRLGLAGVPVPAPFVGGLQATYRFEITLWMDGIEEPVPVFIQELMPCPAEYVEMPKRTPGERNEFASTTIVPGGRVPGTIQTTLQDLRQIRSTMELAPWGDFQVMYNKLTGKVLVFDPLRTDPNSMVYLNNIDAWITAINSAILANTPAAHAPVNTQRPRRNSAVF